MPDGRETTPLSPKALAEYEAAAVWQLGVARFRIHYSGTPASA
jgi:hypothetical protein